MNKNNNWSFGWDNVNWEMYARVYKEKKDKDSTFINININLLKRFFEIRFSQLKQN
jgi:hypothetical protein